MVQSNDIQILYGYKQHAKFDLERAITPTKMVRSPRSKYSWSWAYKLLLRIYGQHENNVFPQTQGIIMTV